MSNPPDFKWNPEQKQAIERIQGWSSKSTPEMEISLSGPGGTGKTTCLKAIKPFLEGKKVVWAAMTGKAALRMREAAGVEAKTLHSVLYKRPSQGRNNKLYFNSLKDPGDIKYLVVDEASMLNPKTYSDLQAWVAQGVRILFIGDGYQLPPVMDHKEVKEYGEDFSIFAKVEGPQLDQVMRSGDDIITVATQLRREHQLPKHSIGEAYKISRSPTPGMDAVESWLQDNDGHMLITWRNKMRMAANRLVRKRLGYEGIVPNKGEPIMICKNGDTDSGPILNGEIHFAEEFREGAHFGPEVKCMNFYTDFGLNILANTQGKDEPMDGFMPKVKDWKEYMRHFRISRLPDPVPVTYGYVSTAHKCVSPDTLVETGEGLVPISELAGEGEIATPDGMRGFSNKVVNAAQECIKIVTKDGYSLTTTPDHGIDVWNGSEYVRAEVKDLKKGDFLRLRLGCTAEPSLAPTLVSSPECDVRDKQWNIPTEIDQDLAEFMGLMVADGTIFKNGFRLLKRHGDVAERFMELTQGLFGVSPKRYQGIGAYGYEVQSAQIAEWLRRVGGMSPNDKYVPDVVLRSPIHIQAKFLRGLFEDGGVSIKNGTVDHVEFTSSSERLRCQVRTMLLRFGIISGCTAKKPCAIYLYGTQTKTFSEEIGFVAKSKNDRLNLGCPERTRYLIPVSRPIAREVAKKFKASHGTTAQNAMNRGTVTRSFAQEMIDALPSDDSLALALKEGIGFHHTKVDKVESVASDTMCVEVPDGHRFLQNGFSGWNCQGSEYRRVTIFLSAEDMANEHFRKDTLLPNGKTMPFSARWIYTALTRAKSRVSLVLGS